MNELIQSGEKFGVIIADPPWDYSNSGVNGAAAKHYRTMKPRELAALPVSFVAADDCLLLLWATWPNLTVAIELARSWGFKYKTGFPWLKLQDDPQLDSAGNVRAVKPAYGTGFWVRGCSEPVLLCTRGAIKPAMNGVLGLLSKRFAHSRKPDNLYEVAEAYPGPWLELFARREREGWVSWGNELATA